MNSIPKKAVVFYCPIIPNQAMPYIDKISLAGCSGQIALEQRGDIVTQLMGTSFEQRFHPMTICLLSNQTEPIESVAQIYQKQHNVVMVDFTDYQGNPYLLINQACQQQPNRPDMVYYLIAPAPVKKINQQHPMAPRQSHVMKQGVQLAIADQTLVYSCFHSGSCRQDKVERFDGQEIVAYGGHQMILAWHLMAEIAYKLGFTDKYGA
ncbi:hypothetical protein BD560DRAFT_399352 [Blakeslea trispora]|nr:hypothetical protein BD560DRAFT_399352 [Blakeslea trispora]